MCAWPYIATRCFDRSSWLYSKYFDRSSSWLYSKHRFPDLDERFERTPEGMYEPKVGHEEELKYREMMRKQDQDKLVKKRLTTRVGPSSAI